jgi:hypothetical protein
MRASIGATIDIVEQLQVAVDGNVISNLQQDFRVQSPVYTAILPADNVLRAIGEKYIHAGTYWGVDDGIYVMLPPLSSGPHTLRFTGTFPDPINFTIDVTYTLAVQEE